MSASHTQNKRELTRHGSLNKHTVLNKLNSMRNSASSDLLFPVNLVNLIQPKYHHLAIHLSSIYHNRLLDKILQIITRLKKQTQVWTQLSKDDYAILINK
jgi:hypothetical protein